MFSLERTGVNCGCRVTPSFQRHVCQLLVLLLLLLFLCVYVCGTGGGCNSHSSNDPSLKGIGVAVREPSRPSLTASLSYAATAGICDPSILSSLACMESFSVLNPLSSAMSRACRA